MFRQPSQRSLRVMFNHVVTIVHGNDLAIAKAPLAMGREVRKWFVCQPIDAQGSCSDDIRREFADSNTKPPALIELAVEIADRFAKSGKNLVRALKVASKRRARHSLGYVIR